MNCQTSETKHEFNGAVLVLKRKQGQTLITNQSIARRNPAPKLAFYGKAFNFAKRLGWPSTMQFSVSNVSWQIAPNDGTITAEINVEDDSITATLIMKYMNREVKMIHLSFDGEQERSEGLLHRKDIELAIQVFKAHVASMLYGPVQMKAAA